MESFSQRKGIKPVKTEIQRESMDDDLRTGLWNLLYSFYFKIYISYMLGKDYLPTKEQKELIENLWISYFKLPVDELEPKYCNDRIKFIKDYYNKCEWYEVYDFIEFIPQTYRDESINERYRRDKSKNEKFREECNSILKSHLSAYRFVDDKIAEITSELEIEAIESASQIPIPSVQVQLNRALELFSDRENPDYRNSIKDSINAVESLCKRITGNSKATLGEALKEIETKPNIGLHPALKEAFSKLYGYTSNADCIRHGQADEPNLDLNTEARFMLVACSAFINYLTEKASKAGINLQ
ncbi:MAG: hypothetical protein AAB116_01885 [Candidatus Poribacteria bacterium]